MAWGKPRSQLLTANSSSSPIVIWRTASFLIQFSRCSRNGRLALGCSHRAEQSSEIALLQSANFVPERGGFFELEFFGGFTHLCLQLRDQMAQFVFALNTLCQDFFCRHGDIIRLDDRGQ